VGINETDDGLNCSIVYNTDLFETTTIRRLIEHWRRLLRMVINDLDRPLWVLPVFSEVDAQQVLEWNATEIDYGCPESICGLIERHVERRPEAIAVVFEEEHLSYLELNARANQLACFLSELGMEPEERVGLCLERGLGMLVGLLGILKVGAAYVPLDPHYPQQRLDYMLEDSRARVLLTQRRFRANWPRAEIVEVEPDSEVFARECRAYPTSAGTEDNLAYLIYTSGSTGRPKGVQIPRLALSNILNYWRELLRLSEKDVCLAITSISFDIAALELFLPLISGARLVITSTETAYDGIGLVAKVTESGASFAQATPTTWRLIASSDWSGSPELTMFCGGESLPEELAKQLWGKGASLWNVYGPTETTIWSSAQRADSYSRSIFIGHPLANTRVYLSDRQTALALPGTPGEIHIGGVGLARGYAGRPDLTGDRFIPDAFSGEIGQRLYRTGDLGRQFSDGSIKFLDRLDRQVKIGGFRIELAEIEAALSRHPGVVDCVVVATDHAPGRRRINAYLIALDQPTSTSELRAWLKRTLPDYMIPATFIWLPDFPLTPNGKVDRRALQTAAHAKSESTKSFVAARTETEEILARIWAELLGVDRVGIYDDFFELGGHSLMIAQLGFRLRASLHIGVPLRALYGISTVANLATMINHDQVTAAQSEQLSRALNRTRAMSTEQKQLLLRKRRDKPSV